MMYCLAGQIFDGKGFLDGYLEIEDGVITAIGRGAPPIAPVTKGIVMPSLCNSHTHLGDAFITKSPPSDLEAAVKPPDGWKHRMLESADDGTVIKGMHDALNWAFSQGTANLLDFREGGLRGVGLLARGAEGNDASVSVLGRPAGLEYDREEVKALLSTCAGLGISGISDWPWGELRKVARDTTSAGKVLGLHASEKEREDIDAILDLRPTFLVHMCAATDSDLELCRDTGIPIVVCPRSNRFFGLRPVLERALGLGVELLLGTDNAMLSDASILHEMASMGSWVGGRVDTEVLLRPATSNPRKTFNWGYGICLEEGMPADLVVFEGISQKRPLDFEKLAVRGPSLIIKEEKVWRNDNGIVQEDTDTN